MSETNDVDEETFGDAAADVDAGVGLPDFFTTKDTSGDQEFTSLMQDLKAAALADDGADSGAGGLDSLLDPRDVGGLPDFFKTAAGGALAEEALSGGGDGGGGGGGRNTSLFDPLASFDLRSEGQEDDGASLFASLGLETAEQQRRRHQQQQQQQREQQQREQQQREQQQREQQQREQQQRQQQQREQQQREHQQREHQQREQQQREQQQREQQQREQQQREQQQREQLQKQLQQQQQHHQQEEEAEDFLSPPSVGGDPGERGRGLGGVLRDAEDDAFGGTDQSEWDRMQKQFEDMHKSFLQDYRQIEEDEDDGALDSAADEGKQTAFATMRQLSLDDLDPSPDDDTETEEAAAARVGGSGTPGPLLTGPNVLPPGAKTLEELEAAMITVSPASIRSPPSLAAVARVGTTPPGLTRADGLAGPGTPGVLERQAVSGDKRIVRGAGEGGRGGEEVRQEEVVVSSQGMAWRQAHHHHMEHQQHSVGIQTQLGSDGVPPQVNLRGGARAGPPPPPPVGQHRQGSVMLPARSGHPLSTVGGLPPSPQMGNAMLQGRKPPHHFQQHQQHQQHQQLQQHQQHQQHQQQGFPGFPSPGMPPFHTLPPHVQAHLMQRRAMAHARTTGVPPRPSQPPHPPRFGSGGGSGSGGGGSAPGLPVLPQQQQHLQQQQQQQQHSGGSIPRSGVLAGVPMMSPGQQAFTQRESGGGGVRAPPGLVMPTLQSPTPTYPHPPTPWFGRPPMPPPSPILTPQQQHLQQHQHHHMQHIQHMHGGSGSRPDARPPLPPLEMFPRGELMTAYDTRYVIMAQMRALETPDPFNDDFYFHNAMRRKQELSLREGQGREGQGLEGLRGGDAHARARRQETAPAMPMPLPVWQETKEIARKVKDEQADAVKKRIRQWESENRVLGHHARSDVHRPRALLSLSGAGGEGEDGEGGSTDGDVLVSGGAPFETHLWRARSAIQRATKAMLAAYELNYLLHLPTTPHAKKVEVAGRLRNVIVDLAVSLGLQRSTILQQDDGRPPPDASTLEASLDLRVLSTVLELTKGQKLLSRCLTMLPPGQRSALVPSVLALTLARAPAANLRNAPSDQVKADAIKAEETLALELKNVVQSPASLPLPILRRCVELVMTAHRGRGSLAAALGSVSRAEVLAAVLRKGGELSQAEGGEAAADWAELQAEFIAMAKESPTGSQ